MTTEQNGGVKEKGEIVGSPGVRCTCGGQIDYVISLKEAFCGPECKSCGARRQDKNTTIATEDSDTDEFDRRILEHYGYAPKS